MGQVCKATKISEGSRQETTIRLCSALEFQQETMAAEIIVKVHHATRTIDKTIHSRVEVVVIKLLLAGSDPASKVVKQLGEDAAVVCNNNNPK